MPTLYTLVKNLFSLILPITVLIVVPRWIEKHWVIQSNFHLIGGGTLALIGLSIMVICISSFIRIGKGTLAPWSPPKHFVVTGLYRYVRNPMIVGVLTVLLGEAWLFNSLPILQWAGTFFLLNTLHFILLEEPQLEERFGEEYRRYKKEVGRWVPRVRRYVSKGNEERIGERSGGERS